LNARVVPLRKKIASVTWSIALRAMVAIKRGPLLEKYTENKVR
jgi:hypothetical protein